MLRFGGCSDRGRVRERNEDSFLFDAPLGLAIVADGMGGHRAGEVASQMAIELIYQKLQSCDPSERSASTLRDALVQASTQIFECGRKDVTKRDMGSTVVAVWILETRALVAHVGDSRAYLCRNGEVRPLTHDHTLVQELINAGRISPEEAETHRLRNVLSRAMGVSDETEADLLEFELESDDRIVLCSDGLHGYASQEALYQLFISPQDPSEKANALIRLANEGGGGDNITALIVDISGIPKRKIEEYRDEPTLEMNSSAMNAVISAIDLAEAQTKTQELPPIHEPEKSDIKTHEELPVIAAQESISFDTAPHEHDTGPIEPLEDPRQKTGERPEVPPELVTTQPMPAIKLPEGAPADYAAPHELTAPPIAKNDKTAEHAITWNLEEPAKESEAPAPESPLAEGEKTQRLEPLPAEPPKTTDPER